MTMNLPGDATSYPTNVVAPVDGEAATGLSIQTPLDHLADRTAWLRRNPSIAARTWQYFGDLAYGSGAFTPSRLSNGLYTAAAPARAVLITGDYVSGNASALYSVDGGRFWTTCGLTETEHLHGSLRDPSSGNWIIYGDNGTIHRAANPGASWTDETLAATTQEFYCGAADGAGRIVLAGGSGGDVTGFARLSDDGGDTWSTPTNFVGSGFTANYAYDMVYGGGTWVSVGARPTYGWISSSADGDTWVNRVTGTSYGVCRRVAYTGTHFVVVTDAGEVLRASETDPATWASIDVSALGSGITWKSLAADPGGSGVLLAGATGVVGKAAISTDHGATWAWLHAYPFSCVPVTMTCTGEVWVTAGTGTNFRACQSGGIGA